MTQNGFGFYFEAAGRGATSGAISPAEQFFEGSHAEESLVRETGQNSLDARAGDAPVVMVFELASVPIDSIPGMSGLRGHIAASAVATEGAQGHARMLRALETARSDEVMVLRISDYGTKGLGGSESINDPQSPLSALTRGAGISADDGARGGSFGIGSAVGPMSSDLCTVLYTSLPKGSPDVVFAGYSRLASHRDSSGAWRVGDGFHTDLSERDDFRYLRNPAAIGPFGVRTEHGTDIYILGYRKAAVDADLAHVRVAFLNNFLPAIHRGHLVVKGVSGGSEWVLDAETLPLHVEESAEATAFYRALLDPEPTEVESPRFGRISLRVHVDEALDRTLHTITVRKPLMKIDTFRHTSIQIKYAAILECSDDKGNTLLRELEPPQHHRWDPERAPGGRAALKELKDFVRDALKKRVKDQMGDHVEVKGLARYLPAPVMDEVGEPAGTGGVPRDGEGSEQEAATVQGAAGSLRPEFNPGRRSVRLGVRTPAGPEGDDVAEKGKDRGGKGTRKDQGGNIPGTGGQGGGTGRISAGDVRFRSWTDASTGELCLALTAADELNSDLELVALGPGGSSEDGYTLPISAAKVADHGGTTALTHAGNVIKDLHLPRGATTLVRLTLSSDHRYRLGVK